MRTMKKTNLTAVRARLLVGATMLVLAAASANATSVFSGFAVADLTINSVSSPAGLTASGFSFNEEEQSIIGNANALADGLVLFSPSGPGAGLDLSVSSFGEGSADLPEGEGLSLALATGALKLENTSDSAISVDYSLDVVLDVLVEAVPDGEDAFVDSVVEVLVDGELLEVFALFADAIVGPEFDFLEFSEDYSLTLDPSEYVEIEITTSVVGLASVVPVPAALPLMLSGLAGLAAFARRRNAG